MIQRVLNYITIRVPGIDLTTVTDVEVTIEQRTTDTEITYSGDSVLVVGPHLLTVTVPKSDALNFDKRAVKGQVMFTDENGVPGVTKIFFIPMAELLKEDGYGR